MADQPPSSRPSRRRVLRYMGWLGAGVSLPLVGSQLQGGGSRQPLFPLGGGMQPALAQAGSPSRVALVRGTNRFDATLQAMNLFGLPDFAGKSVVIKPNFNSAEPAPASTDLRVLIAVVTLLKRAGASRITVADRSGMPYANDSGFSTTYDVMAAKGVFDLAATHGFDIKILNNYSSGDGAQYYLSSAQDWTKVDASNWPGATPLNWTNGFALPNLLLDADAVISLCCLKTHNRGGLFTMALKNSIGMVAKTMPGDSLGNYNYMLDLHRRADDTKRQTMVAEVNALYQPDLVVVDGVESYIEGGPDGMGNRDENNEESPSTVAKTRLMLVGTDRVALDAVGVAALRAAGTPVQGLTTGSIWDLPQIKTAVDLGLGAASPSQIELVTNSAEGQSAINAIQQHLN